MTAAAFWYEFASTYSYPAAMRVEALAATRGVTVAWRPFLLAPIFAAQGWRDSPFNLYPVKGRYMWRDLERICARAGLPFRQPDPFPQNGLLAARVALALADETRGSFSRAVYAAEFGEGRPISDRTVLSGLLASVGLNPGETLARAESDVNKGALKLQSARAAEIGIFGAPTLVTPDGEIFWGDDRLEQGLDWAREHS